MELFFTSDRCSNKSSLGVIHHLNGLFAVEYVNQDIQQRAGQIFEEKAVSKKNTIFDAIVAATAERLEAEAVFSFDGWYPKLGLKLVD